VTEPAAPAARPAHREPETSTPARASRTAPWLLAGALLAGAALRLLWAQDMEYKADEAFMFERSQRVGVSEPWPAVGMPSGVGLVNPGMSVWVFVALARVTGAADPVALTRAVMGLNVLALAALAWFALRVVRRAEREPWLWALGLAAVNPMAIQLQRKIWAQSVLPLLCVLTLVGWWNRARAWGAFLWGLVGVLLGQIHMSGLFFFGGFSLWAALFDRRRVRWRWWSAGTLLGALPMVPWMIHVVAGGGESGSPAWKELFRFRFWGHWTGEAVGFHMGRSLGMHAFWHFLSTPVLAGRGTWLVGVVHLALYAAVLVIFAVAARALWGERAGWRSLVIGRASETAFTQSAALWGFGILLTAAMMGVARHYLMVVYPLNLLWLARLALIRPVLGRRALFVVGAAQLVIALSFLTYVHTYGGAPEGDYGVSYSRQISAPEPP
jgi:hypothetical protein